MNVRVQAVLYDIVQDVAIRRGQASVSSVVRETLEKEFSGELKERMRDKVQHSGPAEGDSITTDLPVAGMSAPKLTESAPGEFLKAAPKKKPGKKSI